jgi:uncharacterized protein YggE
MLKKLFILAMLASATLATAQTATTRTPFIRASGEGVVTIKPDQAKVVLGVTTQGNTAEEATARNAEIVAAVLNDLRAALGASADIRTVGFNVYPNYRTPNPGQPSTIAGYTCTNSVEITMSDTAGVGRIIDIGTKAGANTVSSVRFLLKDSQPSRAQALRLATQQARTQAEAIAQGLGARVGRILAAADSTTGAISPIRDGAPGLATTTPIEAGTLEVRATVTIEAEIVI